MSTCLHVWAGHAAHPFRKPQQGLVLRGVSQTLQHSDHTLHLTSSPWHVMHTHCYSNHYGLEMITPWSLSLISLVTQIPHWERPTFSPQKALCLLKCYTSFKVCFKCFWLCASFFDTLCGQWLLTAMIMSTLCAVTALSLCLSRCMAHTDAP